ncbi:MAG: succinate dehydrogenase, hydrophobic membrane anchor protein [Alphaproteobacteria bacterium]
MKLDYTSKWLLQKVLAITFLATFIFIVYSLNNLEYNDFNVIHSWLNNYFNSFIVLILFISIFFHSNIGLSSIIDDYFHNEIIKRKILLIKNFFFAVLLFITIFSLTKLVI